MEKIRLQDVVEHCESNCCIKCKYYKKGECTVLIDGFEPYHFSNYVQLAKNCSSLAKAIFTNEEIEL